MDLSFTYSPVYLLLIIPFAGVLAWWMYRKTKDVLPKWPRRILGTTRFLALCLLGILLLQLFLTNRQLLIFPPIIAVLQDNSESLLIQRDSNYVKEKHPEALQQFIQGFEGEEYEVASYSFDRGLNKLSAVDSLTFDQAGTDISYALSEISELYQSQNLGAIVLISDGIPTAGSNPLFASQNIRQPIYTVLLGDTTTQKDIKIEEVLFNEIAYLQNEIPVKVKIKSQGFDRTDLQITLRGHGKVLGKKTLTLNRNQPEGNVEFLFKPEEAGQQGYSISVTNIPGEITYRNNFRRIFINVLETRAKIALFAGSPHPDLGALQQAFDRNQGYELTSFILRSPGDFYNSPNAYNLADFDLFILHNFPQSSQDKAWVDKLLAQVKEEKKPIMHWVGAFTDLRTLSALYPYMALSPTDYINRSEEVIADFQNKYRNHSTYTFGENWLSWMNSAPPLYRNRSNWQSKPTAEIFATARIKNVPLDYPVFALQNHLGRKNSVFLGENFWRMRAHSYLETDDFENFDAWLFNMIKWLMVDDDKRKFRVNPSQKVFAGGEPVLFRGQVYDDSYNPVPGVDIKLQVTDPEGKENEYFLNENSNGRYALELYNLAEGTYRYVATGRKDNVRVGEDRGQFAIGRSNIEHFQLQADQGMMQQLALRTNGGFYFATEMDQLASDLRNRPDLKPVRDFKNQRTGLNELIWPLILLLLMLSAEWVVRKLYSML